MDPNKLYEAARKAVETKEAGWEYAQMALEAIFQMEADDYKLTQAINERDAVFDTFQEFTEFTHITARYQTASWESVNNPPEKGLPVVVCSDRRIQIGADWRFCIAGKAYYLDGFWYYAETNMSVPFEVTYWLKLGPRLELPLGEEPFVHAPAEENYYTKPKGAL